MFKITELPLCGRCADLFNTPNIFRRAQNAWTGLDPLVRGALVQRKEEKYIVYAVVETGGKQYRVQAGDVFRVERLEGDVGQEVVLDKVHMVGMDDATKFGAPLVDGAAVKAEILSQARADKVLVFRYKSKKNVRRMRGHRQYYTEIRVKEINV